MIERLGGDVSRELRRLGPPGSIAQVVERWRAAVGEQIAAHAWPARIARDGTLLVHARDSIWAFELGQRAAEIRARLGDVPVSSVRFVPGPLPEAVPEAPAAEALGAPRPLPEDESRAASLAACIDDGELREIVAKAAAMSLAKATADRSFW